MPFAVGLLHGTQEQRLASDLTVVRAAGGGVAAGVVAPTTLTRAGTADCAWTTADCSLMVATAVAAAVAATAAAFRHQRWHRDRRRRGFWGPDQRRAPARGVLVVRRRGGGGRRPCVDEQRRSRGRGRHERVPPRGRRRRIEGRAAPLRARHGSREAHSLEIWAAHAQVGHGVPGRPRGTRRPCSTAEAKPLAAEAAVVVAPAPATNRSDRGAQTRVG